jgi:hypothetical protein
MESKAIKVTCDDVYGFDAEDGMGIRVEGGSLFSTIGGAIILALGDVDEGSFPSVILNRKCNSIEICESYVDGDITHYLGVVDISEPLEMFTKILKNAAKKAPRPRSKE